MNLPCEIVMDLVTLYQDGLANPVTKDSVAAHCGLVPTAVGITNNIADSLKNLPIWDRSLQKNAAEQEFCRLAEKMRHRRMLIGIGFFSYVCASWCLLVMLWMRMRKRG